MPLTLDRLVVSAIANHSTHDIARSAETDWPSFVEMFDEPLDASTPKAELPLWSAVSYRDGYQTDANVECVYALTYDVDKEPIPSREQIEGLASLAVVSTSSSSTAAAQRWRLVFALSRPVTGDEYRRLWGAVSGLLPFPVGQEAKNPSRGWYAPRRGEDGSYTTFRIEGDVLDVDELLALDPAENQTAPSVSTPTPKAAATPARRTLSASALLGSAWPATGRHAAQLALAGALARDGWEQAEAVEFLCNVCRTAGNEDRPKREQTIAHTYQKAAADSPYTGWTSLEAHVDPVIVGAVRGLLDPAAGLGSRLERIAKSNIPNNSNKPETIGDMGETWGRWDEPIEPPVYLLEGLIPEAKVITLFAEGGSLKSWAAFALAISVATGRPWLGTHAVKQGKVLILDYEDGRYEFQRRIRILREEGPLPDLGYLYGGPQIDKLEFWAALSEKVQREAIRLVVIDALNSAMPGNADENVTAFSAGMKLAGRLTEAGVTVVFIHHANKSGGMRGSTTVRDQSDVVFRFEPVSETDDVKRMRMVCDKAGPQKRPKPVNVELSDRGLVTFADEAAAASRNATTPSTKEAAVLLHLANGRKGAEELKQLIGGNDQAVTNAIKILREQGKIRNFGKYVGYGLDSPTMRQARVVEAARTCTGKESDLARDANVDLEDVEDAKKAKLVQRQCTGDVGGFFVL